MIDHSQKIWLDYEEVINYAGVFGQTGVFKRCCFRILFRVGFNTQSHVRTEFLNAANDGQATNRGKKVNKVVVLTLQRRCAYSLSEQRTYSL